MTIDILPTLAHLTSATLPAHPIDGKNIWSILSQREAKSPHEAIYFYWNRELQGVRSGPWKLHLPHKYSSLKASPGQDGKPSPYEQKQMPLSLYHLEKDPGETTNLATGEPDQIARLMKFVEQARSDLGDSLTKREGSGVRQPGLMKTENR